MMQHYNFDRRYGEMFAGVGVPMTELLRKSNLPDDLFSRQPVMLTQEEIFRLLEVVGTLLPDDEAIIRIATWKDIQTFSPPVFAAYCSQDAVGCVERLAKYKRLVCPLVFTPHIDGDLFHVEISGIDATEHLPAIWAELEAAFIVSLIRIATREHITPTKVTMRHEMTNPALKAFWDCPVERGFRNIVTFRLADARKRFVSENEEMWKFFEPELKRRLSEMQVDDTMSTRVRSALIELLPSGNCRIDDAASKLFLSKRTLQRKLAAEGTTFQQQLNQIRELLAKHYIKDENLQSSDIAFLLGYQDTNAFLRAFSTWTGKTLGKYRSEQKHSSPAAEV